MTLRDFFFEVTEDNQLLGIDIHEAELIEGEEMEESYFVVQELKTNWKTKIPVSVILDNVWETLRAWIMGTKDLLPLYHVSRIVGYFSRIENWNKSKLGELADRRKGNYNSTAAWPELPEVKKGKVCPT